MRNLVGVTRTFRIQEETTMLGNWKKLVLLAGWAIFAGGAGYPQDVIDRLQPLVETSARRLAIAEQVALAKWDGKTPVEDASREERVLAGATKAGLSRGLDATSVSNFFRAQIEANKLVQYALLAEWRRAGKAPDHTPVDLARTIRPELDEVDKELIAELGESVAIRASASCRTEIARSTGRYASAHKNDLGSLEVIALDRALASACTGPLR